jgi:hypothetical protein
VAVRDPAAGRHAPPSLGRLLAFLAPVVFLTEFALAWSAYARDWAEALLIAGVITPVTLVLAAVFWRTLRKGD